MAEFVESIGEISDGRVGQLLQNTFGDLVSVEYFHGEAIFSLTILKRRLNIEFSDWWLTISHQIDINNFEILENKLYLNRLKEFIITKAVWVKFLQTDESTILVTGNMVLRSHSSTSVIADSVASFLSAIEFIYKEIAIMENK